MTNTFLTPSIIAKEALRQLSSTLVMGGLVYRGYDKEFRKVGSSITIRKPPVFTVRDVVADKADAGLVTQNITEEGVTLTVTEHKYIRFAVGSAEKAMSLEDLAVQVIRPAILPLAEYIDAFLAGLYTGIPYHYGTAGTTPDSLDDLAGIGQVLADNKCPTDDIALVVNPACQAKLWPVMAAMNVQKANAVNEALARAQMGLINNMNTYMDQNIQAHTAGTLDAGALATGTAGASTIAIAAGGNEGTFLKGDVFTITGSTQQFVVTASKTANSSGVIASVPIYPELPAGFSPSGAAVTLVATHKANLAFHRNAIAFATAALEAPEGGARGETLTMNNMTARVIYAWDNDALADTITIDMLFGGAVIYPEMAAVLLG